MIRYGCATSKRWGSSESTNDRQLNALNRLNGVVTFVLRYHHICMCIYIEREIIVRLIIIMNNHVYIYIYIYYVCI